MTRARTLKSPATDAYFSPVLAASGAPEPGFVFRPRTPPLSCDCRNIPRFRDIIKCILNITLNISTGCQETVQPSASQPQRAAVPARKAAARGGPFWGSFALILVTLEHRGIKDHGPDWLPDAQ